MEAAALQTEPTLPKVGTQCHALLALLIMGGRFTVASALAEPKLRIYALSQRIGELKRMGWDIGSEWVETEGGARVKRYYYRSKA